MASGTTPDRAAANSSTIRGRRARSLNSARRPAIIWGGVVATAQRQQDAHLREIGRAMKRSHARQWRELRQLYRDHDTGKFREDFLKHCAALRDTQAPAAGGVADGMGNLQRRAKRRPRSLSGAGFGHLITKSRQVAARPRQRKNKTRANRVGGSSKGLSPATRAVRITQRRYGRHRDRATIVANATERNPRAPNFRRGRRPVRRDDGRTRSL